MTPGAKGRPRLAADSTISGSKPGASPNRAPAPIAASREARSSTVPAPVRSSGRASLRIASVSAAAGVRNVISATARPPSSSASASATASRASPIAMTGTTPSAAIVENGSVISSLPDAWPFTRRRRARVRSSRPRARDSRRCPPAPSRSRRPRPGCACLRPPR